MREFGPQPPPPAVQSGPTDIGSVEVQTAAVAQITTPFLVNQAGPTNASSIVYQVRFTANMTGLTAVNFAGVGSQASGSGVVVNPIPGLTANAVTSVTEPTGTGTSSIWFVTVTGITGNGTIALQVAYERAVPARPAPAFEQ